MDQNNSIKVLQIACGFRKGVSGGVPSFVHSHAMAMDAPDITFDYLSLGYQCFEPYRCDLESLGGTLYELGITGTGMKRLKSITEKLGKFLKDKEYDIVHVNTGSVPQLYYSLAAAKRAGVKATVAHAHNAKPVKGVRKFLYSKYIQGIQSSSDALYAVSCMAAENMFPHSVIRNNAWVLVPDAIMSDRFAFSVAAREGIRREFGLDGKFVVGHVGRFNEQKNHAFLLETFEAICKNTDNAILMLVGTGDLQLKIKQQANDRGISDRVIFMGQRSNVNELMQAMDVFVFPSLYEGLGVVTIEAQAAGLPVVMSDNIPKEAHITKLAHYLPLEAGADAWAAQILKCKDTPRELTTQQIVDAGYDVYTSAATLANFYRELMR